MDCTFRCAQDAHVRVDTTDRNGKHAIEIRVRENDKSDQIAQSEDAGEEASLDGTPNESVQNCIRLAETSSRTGKNDDQCD